MKAILQNLFQHKTLSTPMAKQVLLGIGKGLYNQAQISAFASVFRMRSLSIAELQGFYQALLELALKVNLGDDLIDIVGTGGDGKNTFNISTISCFLVAGAGEKVAKHGNYASSSISGSSNVLERLGYQFSQNQEQLQADLEKSNLCFLHAPLFHPALKTVASMRKDLGVRTFFNTLAPLVNPAQPKHSLIGVYNLEIARMYRYFLQKEGRNFQLIHSLDGYDEISLTDETRIIGRNTEQTFTPKQLGFSTLQPAMLESATPEHAVQVFLAILQGKGEAAHQAVVVANAAQALILTGKYTPEQALKSAKNSLESGAAYHCFQKLIS